MYTFFLFFSRGLLSIGIYSIGNHGTIMGKNMYIHM